MPNTKEEKIKKETVIERLENYLRSYVTTGEEYYIFPIALWIAATHCWQTFDAFPYVCITSLTKQSGKTRLAELMGFTSDKAKPLAGMTPATIFHSIESEHPVLIFDEAEILNSEAATMMRSVLNVGYRRGAKIPRIGSDGVVEYDTYCPKIFILIGDVYDTLRDRSIIIKMKRAKSPKRLIHAVAQSEGHDLRAEMGEIATERAEEIKQAYREFSGLPFLPDRDEEIWTPLFSICKVFCPERIEELTRCAVDMSTEKTSAPISYRESRAAEENAEREQYALILLRNIMEIAHAVKIEAREETKKRKDGKGSRRKTAKTVIEPNTLLDKLKALTTAPWRKYRGEGLSRDQMADLMGGAPLNLKTLTWRIENKGVRVYDLEQIEKRAIELGIEIEETKKEKK